MNFLSIGFDYLTVRFTNTSFSESLALQTLLEVFGYSHEDLILSTKESRKCYYAKQFGTDIKISRREIVIEFHSTFFAISGHSGFRSIKLKLQEIFKTLVRITEAHVAQDLSNLPVNSFFPKKMDNLLFQFKCKKSEIVNLKTRELETINLSGPKARWRLTIYNKTAELKAKINQSSPAKIQHYKDLGYFETSITRVELKFKSEFCNKFIETFESNMTETEICNALLNFFYKQHRIYLLKPNEIFNPKRPEKFCHWSRWESLFSKNDSRLVPSQLDKDATFKNSHLTDIDAVVEKIASYSLRYNQDPRELFQALLENKERIIEMCEERHERLRKTMNYLQGLAVPKAS